MTYDEKKKIYYRFGLFIIPVIVVVALYFMPREQESEKSVTEFKSFQTEMQSQTTPEPESQIVVESVKPEVRRKTAAASRENSVIKHLDQKSGAFQWSPDVFVVLDKTYAGPKENIVGKHEGYLVIKASAKPERALNLVYNASERRLGIYMGKVIAVHERSDEFEQKYQAEYLAGTYFIDVSDLAEAVSTVTNIQAGFPTAQVDLDVNYGRERAN